MSRIPNDGLSVYPRRAPLAEDLRLEEALSAPSPEETPTPTEDKPRRKRRSRQTDKIEE